MSEKEEYVDKVSAIARIRFANPEDALREVAEQILAGNDDPLFRLMLATMIHPDRRPVSGRKLVLSGPNSRPPKARNWALEDFIELNADIHKVPHKIAIGEAMRKFGVSRTVVTDALALARGDRNAEYFAEYKTQVLDLAERGCQEYQPVWSPRK